MLLTLLACITLPDTVKEGEFGILRCEQHIILTDDIGYASDDQMRFKLEEALQTRYMDCPNFNPLKASPRHDALDMILQDNSQEYPQSFSY